VIHIFITNSSSFWQQSKTAEGGQNNKEEKKVKKFLKTEWEDPWTDSKGSPGEKNLDDNRMEGAAFGRQIMEM